MISLNPGATVIDSSGAGTNGDILVPLRLPDGARVTAVRGYINQPAPLSIGATNAVYDLRRLPLAGGPGVLLATAQNTSAGPQAVDLPIADPIQIDLQNFYYVIVVRLARGTADRWRTDDRVGAVRITYTVTTPTP